MSDSTKLTDVEYWSERQASELDLPAGGIAPLWTRQVVGLLPTEPGTSFLEIGVVPGAILMYFASKLGYKCTGVDCSPKVNLIPAAFAKQGLEARFIQTDFFKWQPDEKFDVVYSGGFIEHFTDYEDVVRKHWDLVAPGGHLILAIPTFTTPMQTLFRRFFFTREKMREVWDAHNTSMMNLGCLRRAVEGCPDVEILVASYIGEMTVWFGADEPGIKGWTKPFFRPVQLAQRVMAKIGKSSSFYSPMAVLLARRKS